MRICPSCGAKNEERGLFCSDCGQRFAAGPGSPSASPGAPTPPPVEAILVPETTTGSLHGVAPPVAPAAPSSLTTESGKPAKAAACTACGYRIPEGQAVSWCPGCGCLFDVPLVGRGGGGLPAAPAAPPAAPVPMERTQTRPFGQATVPPAPRVPPPPATAVPPGWALVLLRAGERLDRYPLRKPEVLLGRTEGDFTFPDDPLLSPRHARVVCRGRTFLVEDADSRNGVYVRLRAAAELRPGDHVNFGSLVFRYEPVGSGLRTTSLITVAEGVKVFGSGSEKARGQIVRILRDGSDGPAYPLTPSRTILGRKVGHFLYPDDPLLSRQHVQFYERDGEMWVEDLGSSNGTLIRIREPVPLEKGSVFRMGDVTLEVAAP